MKMTCITCTKHGTRATRASLLRSAEEQMLDQRCKQAACVLMVEQVNYIENQASSSENNMKIIRRRSARWKTLARQNNNLSCTKDNKGYNTNYHQFISVCLSVCMECCMYECVSKDATYARHLPNKFCGGEPARQIVLTHDFVDTKHSHGSSSSSSTTHCTDSKTQFIGF